MDIKQFRYFSDNLAYVLYHDGQAAAIDGGAAGRILDFIRAADLDLKVVTNTHGHGDHTPGNARLLRETKAEFFSFQRLTADGRFLLGNQTVTVIPTPGHSTDSVCFYAHGFLVTGDTLFNATVGNCFSGDLDGFYRSITTLLSYPDDTWIYAGHDYVAESVAVARRLEPDNPDLDAYFKAYDPALVRSSLGWEKRVNPFLRFNAPSFLARFKKTGLACETERQRWRAVMSLE